MNFKVIQVKELIEFVKSNEFENLKSIPITKQRAYSQFKNPQANPDDIALILALDSDNEVIGYIGFLPDSFYLGNPVKGAWNSCWWTHPTKGKGIAMPLFYKAIQSWPECLFFNDTTPYTTKILKSLPWFAFVKKNIGLRYFLRPYLPDAYNKKPWSSVCLLFFYIPNVAISLVYKILLFLKKGQFPKYEILNNIDNETATFIESKINNSLNKRGANELNWIVTNPWITSDYSESDIYINRYHFSLYSKEFQNLFVKLCIQDEIIGFLYFTIRNGHLKIPYYFYDDKPLKQIASFIYFFSIKYKIKTLSLFDKNLLNALNTNLPFFVFRKKIENVLCVPKKFENLNWDEIRMFDGDGDSVFT